MIGYEPLHDTGRHRIKHMRIIRIIIRALNITYLSIIEIKRFPRNNEKYVIRASNEQRNSSNMLQLFISNISPIRRPIIHHLLIKNWSIDPWFDWPAVNLRELWLTKGARKSFVTKWERRWVKRSSIILSKTTTYSVMRNFCRNYLDVLPYTLPASSVIHFLFENSSIKITFNLNSDALTSRFKP